MPVAVKKNVQQPINGNTVFDFGSGHTVVAQTVGLSGFQVSFPEMEDHHVGKCSISLTPLSTDPGGGGTQTGPTVEITTSFIGSHGDAADPDNSSVGVVCLAVLDDADSDIVLQNQIENSDGSITPASAQPPSDGTTLPIKQAGIAGFDLDFGGDNDKLSKMSCTMGLSVTETTATISPTAAMDSSGTSAQTATANGAVILADSNAQSAFAVTNVIGSATDPQTFTFDKTVEDAVLMLQEFEMSFADDKKYSICQVCVESPGVKIDGNTVTVDKVTNCWMFRNANSGNLEWATGNINFLLITTFKDQ